VDILVRVGAQELAETGATELVEEVAFDSAGNLWVARGESDSVAGYARSELSKASPVPSVIIETSGNADGLAFDRSGDLWVACYDSNAVAEYAKPQLHSSAISLVRTILASGGPAALAIEP